MSPLLHLPEANVRVANGEITQANYANTINIFCLIFVPQPINVK